MPNKPLTTTEMREWNEKTWNKCQEEAWAEPEALRLADWLGKGHPTLEEAKQAAAELRRLHAELEQITQYADALNDRCIRDTERMGALLEALHKLCDAADDSDDVRYGTLSTSFVRDIARAAIAKAEGEKA